MFNMEYLIFCIKDFLRHLPRSIKFFFQRRFRGWDDSETWDLEYQFFAWLYPRLRRFGHITIAHPPEYTWEEWQEILGKLIYRVGKAKIDYENLGLMTPEDEEKHFQDCKETIDLVCKHLKNGDLGW